MRRGERRFRGRIVLVHTFQGPSLRGVLLDATKHTWLLGSVTEIDHDAQLAGQVAVPRANGFLQVPEN